MGADVKDLPTVKVTMEYLNALRKVVGLTIDPANAEVEWTYAHTLDPYGDDPDLPEEYQQVGREHFARSPGSDIWIHFGDLPNATRDALRGRCIPSFSHAGGAGREGPQGGRARPADVKPKVEKPTEGEKSPAQDLDDQIPF
jgi:hypothetical protein